MNEDLRVWVPIVILVPNSIDRCTRSAIKPANVVFQVYAERESAKIVRKIGDRVIIQRDSKIQYSLDEV